MSTPADPNPAIETFREAAGLNLEDPLRHGSLIRFPAYGQLVATGDMHGHRRNFERIVRYCALSTSPARFVLLQELIHSEVEGLHAADTSHELLLDAARWKCEFPDQVFFLQSNHEVCQVLGREVLKGGRGVIAGFLDGLKSCYGQDAPRVMEAIATFIESFPLAARTANRIFLSHSLPADREIDGFDPTILERVPNREDLADGHAARLIWGRRHSAASIDRLSQMLDADLFVVGHQPQAEGFSVVHDRMLILSSDHSHGVFLPIELSRQTTMDQLVSNIHKLAEIA